MSTLFMGGPIDGQHMQVAKGINYIEVAEAEPSETAQVRTAVPESIPTKRLFRYRAEKLRCPHKDYLLFVPVDWSCDDVMNNLLNGYKNSS